MGNTSNHRHFLIVFYLKKRKFYSNYLHFWIITIIPVNEFTFPIFLKKSSPVFLSCREDEKTKDTIIIWLHNWTFSGELTKVKNASIYVHQKKIRFPKKKKKKKKKKS